MEMSLEATAQTYKTNMRQILYHLPILLTAMLLQTVATNAMLPGMHIQQALSKQSTDSLSATLVENYSIFWLICQ